ncbi:hypothetical protein TrVE_jg13595 [Triparma verrucosa]|uniref:Uncharacterized protein n=1 Tax=Triparma verrucosa TaxID=1606542 RepID=A0A9W7BVX9_9STRA|nr:hypothetical protein TrVE_jg13595 [Triparma verrucosa]
MAELVDSSSSKSPPAAAAAAPPNAATRTPGVSPGSTRFLVLRTGESLYIGNDTMIHFSPCGSLYQLPTSVTLAESRISFTAHAPNSLLNTMAEAVEMRNEHLPQHLLNRAWEEEEDRTAGGASDPERPEHSTTASVLQAMESVYLPPAASSLGKFMYGDGDEAGGEGGGEGDKGVSPPKTLRWRSTPAPVLASAVKEHLRSGGAPVYPTPWITVDQGAVTLQSVCKSVKLTIPFDAPYYFVSTSFHVPHLLDPLSALPGRDEVILESFVQTSRFDKKVGGWGGDVERVEEVLKSIAVTPTSVTAEPTASKPVPTALLDSPTMYFAEDFPKLSCFANTFRANLGKHTFSELNASEVKVNGFSGVTRTERVVVYKQPQSGRGDESLIMTYSADPLHVSGLHERWGEGVDEVTRFSLEGNFVNITTGPNKGCFDITFLTVLNPNAQYLISQSLKFRTHLQNVESPTASSSPSSAGNKSSKSTKSFSPSLTSATMKTLYEPIKQVNDAGKFTLLTDLTVTCLFNDRTMLTLSSEEERCTVIDCKGKVDELILNRPDMGGPTTPTYTALRKYSRYLKVAREFKRWALSSKVERLEHAELMRQKEMVLAHAKRNTERQRVLNNIAGGFVEPARTIFEDQAGASGPVGVGDGNGNKIDPRIVAKMKLAEIEKFQLRLKV